MQKLTLRIRGMDCADCTAGIEKSLQQLEGIRRATVQFSTGQLDVIFDADLIDERSIKQRIEAIGYQPLQSFSIEDSKATSFLQRPIAFLAFLFSRWQTICTLVGGILLLAFSVTTSLIPSSVGFFHHILADVLLVLAIVVAGYPIASSGLVRCYLNREININLLMTLATVGALVIGETAEAATVIFLFAIGEALESFTMERSRQSLRSLMDLAPQTANVLRLCIDCEEHIGRGGYTSGPCPYCGVHETQIPVDEVGIGETILAKPGERIPMDGSIVRGESAVDQAPITGESIPVLKVPDSEVYAGSINGSGTLEISVTRRAADTTLNRIIHLVEQAQNSRARTQRFVDRFASIYTPAVLATAVCIAVLPPLFGHPFWNPPDGSHGWLYRALTLLVISCPCALVISTPVSLVSAITAAARQRVLIKGGAVIEALSQIQVIAFDKTGTLTYGQPSVVETRSIDCENPGGTCPPCDDMLALAAAVEGHSEHPLARAVVRAAGDRARHSDLSVANIESIAGRGVRGTVNGKSVTVGSHHLFDANFPHDNELCRTVEEVESNGHTVMMVSEGDQVRGYIAVSDQVRLASRRAIEDLKKLGIRKTVMLTGDNPVIAQTIADGVGVDEVRAGLLPEDKLDYMKSLHEQYGHAAMVGDGINDAPALASADVGIAMGAASDQALEAADVALMSNNLTKLPLVIRHSRKTMRIIKENVAFSIAIKAVFLALALPGVATLWMAVFADMGASLLVTLNGMRLLQMRK